MVMLFDVCLCYMPVYTDLFMYMCDMYGREGSSSGWQLSVSPNIRGFTSADHLGVSTCCFTGLVHTCMYVLVTGNGFRKSTTLIIE